MRCAIHYGFDWYCGPVIEVDDIPTKTERRRLLRNYRARLKYHRGKAVKKSIYQRGEEILF
jgi:hypothetical protein